jgi:hypothetical protein
MRNRLVVFVIGAVVFSLTGLSGCASSDVPPSSGTLSDDCRYLLETYQIREEAWDAENGVSGADVVDRLNFIFSPIWANVSDPQLKMSSRLLAESDDPEIMEIELRSLYASCP